MSVEVNISEIEKLANILNSFCLSGNQKMSLLHDLGVEVREQTLDRFDIETDPEGKSWKKLADATSRYKNKICSGGILEREGFLKDTISVKVIDENSVFIRSPMHYAGFHQEGTSTIPARRFLGVCQNNISELANVMNRWISNHV